MVNYYNLQCPSLVRYRISKRIALSHKYRYRSLNQLNNVSLFYLRYDRICVHRRNLLLPYIVNLLLLPPMYLLQKNIYKNVLENCLNFHIANFNVAIFIFRQIKNKMDETTSLTREKLIENLSIQISEIEMLLSIFCNPGEIRIEDPKALEEIRCYTEGRTDLIPPYVDVTVNIVADDMKFELCVNLPHEYPQIVPDLFVRNHKLDRTQHSTLNQQLTNYVCALSRDEPCLFTAITWIQDNGHNFKVIENVTKIESKSEELIRYWIYSHHIYSKFKRREIYNLANTLKLTGFCLPGKPGIICVEGNANDCNEWWMTIKSMNWKRIFCKITEECREEGDFLKFKNFQEIAFHINGNRYNHMDMGELNKFLREHDCAHIFKELFGVEGKSNEEII